MRDPSQEVARIAAHYAAEGSAFPRMSVAEFTSRQCARFAERIAIEVVETQETLTYADLWSRVTLAADALSARGLHAGDRVAIQMPNGWEYPVLWLALAQIGAVHVPVNTRYSPKEIAYVIADSGAELMIVADDLATAAEQAANSLNKPEIVECAGAFFSSLGWAEKRAAYAPQPDDLLNIQYTSGTTGMPKGCMLTHDYWLVLARSAALWDAVPVQRILSAQPYFYMDPQWITLKTLLNGAVMVIAPGLSSSRFLDWLLDYRIDWCMFPILMARLPRTGREGKTALSQVATFGWDAETCARFHQDYGVRACEGFGMTEIGLGTVMPPELDIMSDSVSTGIGAPCRETSVRRADGTLADPGEAGEFWVRGRSIFQGYWKRPEATAMACPGDGWFRTGDIFTKDSDGFHWITGRLKDMIRRSSENIAAREVEAVLCTLPDIVEASALAEPDRRRGEEVLAVLQHRQGCPADDAVEAFVAASNDALAVRLAVFKRPRYWIFVAEHPRTASNKVQKVQLRKQISGRRAYDNAEKCWVTLP